MSNKKDNKSKPIANLTDVSVIPMDTDNEDDPDLFFTKGGDFDMAESCPDIYRCPISKEMMTKPVMLHDDGHTYDEVALKEWLSDNNRSPLTGVDLKNKSYTRNYALQSAIQRFETAKQKHFALDSNMEKEKSSSNMELSEEKDSELLCGIFPKTNSEVEMYNQLKEFLSRIKLVEYVSTFMNAGFVSMNDFSNITFNDLVSMDIPIIHARRMIKAIDKYNAINNKQPAMLSDVPLTNSIIIRPGRIPKSQNSAPLNCNILLLGDAYVGKTSLRKRLELDDFVLTTATNGVELTCLFSNFQGEDLQITIWDPAGQERYAPITKTFFRRAHAAAIIFAADDPSTWKHVEYWMHELEENAPDDIEQMLICNKIDLLKSNEMTGDIELSELIKKAIEVAAKKRIPFYTTSAKSGESVKQSFQELVSQLLNNRAILDKLYTQRDGTLGRGASYHGFNPYEENSNDSNDSEEKEEFDTPDDGHRKKKKKGKKLARIKKKLSWRSKKNQNQQYREYTEEDYDKTLNLEELNTNNHVQQSGGCCK